MSPQVRELLELSIPQVRDFAVVAIDPTGTIVGWLAGAERIFGYSSAEVEGQPIAKIFAPEDNDKRLPQYELELARNGTSAQDDRWHIRKDGSRIWVSGSVTAIAGPDGALRGYLKIMRDRTDERMAAEERTNRLAATEAALDRTTDFVRQLGHELRNPLSPIKNAAYILPRLSADPRIAQIGETITNQASIMERLASDLMDVARLEQRKIDLRLEAIDICTLLREEAVAHSVEVSKKGVRLQVMLPSCPIIVMADVARLRQAVSNLLGNAVKYTPSGGTVWMKAVEEDDDVAIRIEDTGIGIAPDMLPRIFELFTQESRAREVAPGGLGIGLAIVREIAQLHGGLVQARSAGVGKGSEFTLRLPRRTPSEIGSPQAKGA